MKIYGLLLTLFVMVSCSGDNQKNLENLDKVYGKCDNPHRQLSDIQYTICKDKERAAGGEPFDIETSIQDLLGNLNTNPTYQNATNKYLWNGAIETTKSYPLKIADNQGGYIETDWIYSADNPNERCVIKIQVLSDELVSTGAKVKLLCQEKISENWITKQTDFSNEEKILTLKVLENAAKSVNSF